MKILNATVLFASLVAPVAYANDAFGFSENVHHNRRHRGYQCWTNRDRCFTSCRHSHGIRSRGYGNCLLSCEHRYDLCKRNQEEL
jgi:hypothetical protein